MKTTRLLALTAAAALALNFFACSDDGDDDGSCKSPNGITGSLNDNDVCVVTCKSTQTPKKEDGVIIDCTEKPMGGCRINIGAAAPANIDICDADALVEEADCTDEGMHPDEAIDWTADKCPTTGIRFKCDDDGDGVDNVFVYETSAAAITTCDDVDY